MSPDGAESSTRGLGTLDDVVRWGKTLRDNRAAREHLGLLGGERQGRSVLRKLAWITGRDGRMRVARSLCGVD
ncbi:MAG TPA: hypothetical protein VIL73_04785 [Gaiellaceae bacterium]